MILMGAVSASRQPRHGVSLKTDSSLRQRKYRFPLTILTFIVATLCPMSGASAETLACTDEMRLNKQAPRWCLEDEPPARSSVFVKLSGGVGLQLFEDFALPIFNAGAGMYYADKSSLIVGGRGSLNLGIISIFEAGPVVGKSFDISPQNEIAILAGMSYVEASCPFCFHSPGVYRTVGIPIELFYLPKAPNAGMGFNSTLLVARDMLMISAGVSVSFGKL